MDIGITIVLIHVIVRISEIKHRKRLSNVSSTVNKNTQDMLAFTGYL